MEDLGFHPEFVVPFYLQLMGGNFAAQECQNLNPEFDQQFRGALPKFDDALLTRMLACSNWRPPKVAAWVIGIRRLIHFTDAIVESVLTRPLYAEHLMASLALLETARAMEGVIRYLEQVPAFLAERQDYDMCQ